MSNFAQGLNSVFRTEANLGSIAILCHGDLHTCTAPEWAKKYKAYWTRNGVLLTFYSSERATSRFFPRSPINGTENSK